MSVERWAICMDGKVDNICMWDGLIYDPVERPTSWLPPEGAQMINVENLSCGIGWSWDGSQFTPPPEPVPDEGHEGLLVDPG